MAEGSDRVWITSERSNKHDIVISGSKNAVLPLMAASILTDEEITLENVPKISDVSVMKSHLQSYGITVNGSTTLSLKAGRSTKWSPTRNEGSSIRASFLVTGPLLARLGRVRVYKPGGDEINGADRPVNYHIDALRRMGAEVREENNSFLLQGRLHGAIIQFPRISVGATEQIVMAACLAEGTTTINNAALEPEVITLIDMLKKMGMGEQAIRVNQRERKIVIEGRGGELLNGCNHEVIPDRIEAGTWAIAAAITGRPTLLKMNRNIGEEILTEVVQKLRQAGVTVTWTCEGMKVERQGTIQPVNVTTAPYPGFPTDLLPQWVTFMTLANGESTIIDEIYSNRFRHVPHLQKMNARIEITENKCEVHGPSKLRHRSVEATDIRAGIALVLAALAVDQGTTEISGFHHVRRGYENIAEKLRVFGAKLSAAPGAPPRSGHYGGAQASHYP